MFWLAVISITLSIISTLFLLASPYLRITSLGWFIGIWWIPIFGSLFFLLTVIRNQARAEESHFHELKDAHRHREACLNDQMNCIALDHGFLPYFYLQEYQTCRDDEFIQELLNEIEKAEKRIWLATYIFSGEVSEQVLSRLREAHERGVQVRLLVDRVGSGLIFPTKAIKQFLASYPFQFSIFRESFFKSLIFVEKRLHSKIVIVDDDLAFIGAHNIRDEVKKGHEHFARNISLKFRGPVVQQLEAVFADLWLQNTKESLVTSDVQDSDIFPTEAFGKEPSTGSPGIPARIIFSDPISRTHAYDRYLTILLMSATTRIYIWMPYIIPTQTMRDILMAKSKMGVDVKVLVPHKSDSPLVDNTHQLVLRELLDNDVLCAQSTDHFDHSKILIVDDLVVLGSTNLDYRSLYRNFEANIEVQDHLFAENFAALFNKEFSQALPASTAKPGLVKTIVNQFTSLIAALY